MSDVLAKVSELIHPDCISLDIQSKKKAEIIRELVEILQRAGVIKDADAVTEAVLEREQLTTTGIGGGIAIPHCMSPDAEMTVMAFGRRKAGAKFDSVDRKPVQLFFLMVGPPGSHSEHLRLLSKLARLLHDSELKRGLLDAESDQDVVRLFRERES